MSVDVQVAIVGGGIAGLSTAWHLQQGGPLGLTYALLEASARWGGKICTERLDGFGTQPLVIEGGPDSFLTQKPWALQMARSLGMDERLLPTNDAARRVFVLNRGRPTPLPDGVLLIVPTRFLPFALSPLISPLGKLRMGLDLLIPARRDGADETLADFVRRRLGAEALDKIAEPLMAGIYNAEAERQSLLATFPRFRELEERHGSLIRGMLASRRARAGQPAAAPAAPPRPPSMFVSLRDGMEELVQGLLAQLWGDCRLETGVRDLQRRPEGGYLLSLTGGERLSAQAVVLAIPAYTAAEVLRKVAPAASAGLAAIRYVSTGTISLAYRRAEVAHPLNGFGLVIPRSEGRAINAVTWTSTKFDHRAPDETVLLRVFFGGSRQPAMMELDDQALVASVRRELRELMGIDTSPLVQRIYRWHRANPQYDLGHLERVEAIEASLPPGLFVTGSPYRGVGIPDCVHQAQLTATQVLAQLAQLEGQLGVESVRPAVRQ